MQCPSCNSLKNSVVDSRLTDHNLAIRRRRHCDSCGHRFTTFERLRTADLIVIKKDQTREQYDREKLERGIWKACEKRPVKKDQIEALISRLEEKWAANAETPTFQIGEDIMGGLKNLDPVAYIRFASVYRQFTDVESFERIIKNLLETAAQGPEAFPSRSELRVEDGPEREHQRGLSERKKEDAQPAPTEPIAVDL